MSLTTDEMHLRNTLNACGAAHEAHESLTRMMDSARDVEHLRAELAKERELRQGAEKLARAETEKATRYWGAVVRHENELKDNAITLARFERDAEHWRKLAAQYDTERNEANARCSRLEVALSERTKSMQEAQRSAERAKECAGEPDCGWHNGGPCPACKASLSARDEFAKAAMQATVLPTSSEATRLEVAQRAYAMADAMLKARGG